MKWLNWFFHAVCSKRLNAQTAQYLKHLSRFPIEAARKRTIQVLRQLAAEDGPKVQLGETMWGAPVRVPLEMLMKTHAIVTGGTGSGKTRVALLVLQAVLDELPRNKDMSVLVNDAKGDLYNGGLYLLMRRLQDLERTDAVAAEQLRRRITLIDFAARHPAPITSYNLMARWPGADPDYFRRLAGRPSDRSVGTGRRAAGLGQSVVADEHSARFRVWAADFVRNGGAAR